MLHKDRRRANLKNRVEESVEQAILAFAIDNPAAGQVRVSNEDAVAADQWHLRSHKTVLNEFYQVAFRKKIYTKLEELQTDLDALTRGRMRTTMSAHIRARFAAVERRWSRSRTPSESVGRRRSRNFI